MPSIKIINRFTNLIFGLIILLGFVSCSQPKAEMKENQFTLMNVDPGHFHAALVQKDMYDGMDSTVYVYAPEGAEVDNYLASIQSYNQRQESPTSWDQQVYLGSDFFENMLANRPGNVMVVSGNNAKKTDYIHRAIGAGIHVLADKPMVIHPDDFPKLVESFRLAGEKGVLLFDIMTERFEVTTILQKLLSRDTALFGTLQNGTPEDPAITKESVHHYSKIVSGKPLKRPAWFFDVTQQGEGIVDVTTHLVDLVMWECYPELPLDYKKDVLVHSAKRWSTRLTPSEFEKVTLLNSYPEYLKNYIREDSILEVFANGEIGFKLKDTHAKVSVIWNYEAPPGTGDTHYSIMKGTRAHLSIRQGAEENYQPILYVEPKGDLEQTRKSLSAAIQALQNLYPGLAFSEKGGNFILDVPQVFKVGHEAHFAEVTRKYLEYLKAGKMPEWEVPNMLVKYFITTEAYRMSR